VVLKIEHNRNKTKPPAEIMGFERKRRAGEGQAFGVPERGCPGLILFLIGV
jgi:hypothetical protein